MEILGHPQIDKFGTTHLNSSIASGSITLQRGQNLNLLSGGIAGQPQLSPRIAILGQHSYKPEERGLTDESTNSVSAHVKRLEDTLVVGFDLMQDYKDEAEVLRKDIDHSLKLLIEKNADVLISVQPCLIDDYKLLKEHIAEQRDENESLYKQLLSLKKETTSTSQKIAMFKSRIERLERTIGVQQPPTITQEDNDTLMTQVIKVGNSVNQAFNLDDTEDGAHSIGQIGGIINTTQPTLEDEDLIDNELI